MTTWQLRGQKTALPAARQVTLQPSGGGAGARKNMPECSPRQPRHCRLKHFPVKSATSPCFKKTPDKMPRQLPSTLRSRQTKNHPAFPTTARLPSYPVRFHRLKRLCPSPPFLRLFPMLRDPVVGSTNTVFLLAAWLSEQLPPSCGQQTEASASGCLHPGSPLCWGSASLRPPPRGAPGRSGAWGRWGQRWA